MAKNNNLGDLLTSIANAIRTKKGTTDAINAQDFDTEIANLPSGGGEYHGIVWGACQTTDFNWTDEMKADCEALALKNKAINLLTGSTYLVGAVDLSGITSYQGNGTLGFGSCTKITSVDLSSLVSANNIGTAFKSCSQLRSVDLSSLQPSFACTNIFQSCTITNLKVHPNALSSSELKYNLCSSGSIRGIELTATATDNVYVNFASCALTSSAVLNILQHLSTNATGKTCAFYNRTITSSDANYSAISSLVASLTNWTITGLTL